MKLLLITLSILIFAVTSFSQDITGQWNGILKIQGIQLRLIFHIHKTEEGYKSTMDSPDQMAKDIPIASTSFDNFNIKLTIPQAAINYEGILKDNIIIGQFSQGGQSFPLDLSRESNTLIRPQEPLQPYSYYSEDIVFTNVKDDVTLSGTLTLPQKNGKFPIFILITGSGPQNRDEEIFGHKPFLVISDFLAKNGIGALRYDDRGIAKSTGNFNTSTSLDFASDVDAAISYLKTREDIDKNKIGLIGHSEGGLIASIIASRNKDVNSVILLAGTGISGDKLLLLQQELIARTVGVSEDDIRKSKEINSKVFKMAIASESQEKLKVDLSNYIQQTLKNDSSTKIPNGMSEREFIDIQVANIVNPWMNFFLQYDPSTALTKVNCPVLALNGEKDLQVPPKENLAAIQSSLAKAGNKDVTVKIFPNLNHLFQECKTGVPNEYINIEQTFSPLALEEMRKWILKRVNNN